MWYFSLYNISRLYQLITTQTQTNAFDRFRKLYCTHVNSICVIIEIYICNRLRLFPHINIMGCVLKLIMLYIIYQANALIVWLTFLKVNFMRCLNVVKFKYFRSHNKFSCPLGQPTYYETCLNVVSLCVTGFKCTHSDNWWYTILLS